MDKKNLIIKLFKSLRGEKETNGFLIFKWFQNGMTITNLYQIYPHNGMGSSKF